LYAVVDTLTAQFESSMKLGADLYPFPANSADFSTACTVDDVPEVPPALTNHAAMIAGIPGAAANVFGATPGESGYAAATAWMRDANNVPVGDKKAIIFTMDGAISDGRCM